MPTVAAGVVTAVQVNGPNAQPQTKLNDPSSGGFWAAVWFVAAIIILWMVV